MTVSGDDVAQTKPNPDPYLLAAELLGVDPVRCVALEDSETGATSAVAAGCLTVVVPSLVPVPAGVGDDHLTALTELDLGHLGELAADRVHQRLTARVRRPSAAERCRRARSRAEQRRGR